MHYLLKSNFLFGFYLISLISFGTFAQCQPNKNNPTHNVPFLINQPDKSYKLSYELTEISGISILNNEIYAVQDEMGMLFQLNSDFKIKNKYRFTGRGDFEGLTKDDSNFYALTSTGAIYKIPFGHLDQGILLPSSLPNSCNFEGIAYKNNLLFIISKGNCDDKYYPGKSRCLFTYDLTKHTFQLEKEFSYKKIKKLFNLTDEGILVDNKMYTYQKPKPSGIAFDPINGDFYILNDSGKVLFICDQENNIKQFIMLDPLIYPQPEGLVFDKIGNLYISCEGVNRPAEIHKIVRQAEN